MMRTLFIALLALPIPSEAQIASCPETLPTGAVAVVRAPEGWRSSLSQQGRLVAGSILRGHPDRMGYLAPSSSRTIKGGMMTTFMFAPGEEKWMWCEYGPGVQIAKRMDDKATECTVTAKPGREGEPPAVEAKCKRDGPPVGELYHSPPMLQLREYQRRVASLA